MPRYGAKSGVRKQCCDLRSLGLGQAIATPGVCTPPTPLHHLAPPREQRASGVGRFDLIPDHMRSAASATSRATPVSPLQTPGSLSGTYGAPLRSQVRGRGLDRVDGDSTRPVLGTPPGGSDPIAQWVLGAAQSRCALRRSAPPGRRRVAGTPVSDYPVSHLAASKNKPRV